MKNDLTDAHPCFVGLVMMLPTPGATWARDERAAWMRAFNCIADLLHPESKNTSDPHGGAAITGEPVQFASPYAEPVRLKRAYTKRGTQIADISGKADPLVPTKPALAPRLVRGSAMSGSRD